MSVILTEGNVPTLSKEQRKVRSISYKANSYRKKTQQSGPVTIVTFTGKKEQKA